MNKLRVLFCIIWLSNSAFCQDTLKLITWENALKMPKDSVFALDASKQKWDSLPAEIYQFTQLRYLNLSKNKLRDLPLDLTRFKRLTTLDVSKNKFTNFPVGICPLTGLKKLIINRNQFETIPACIGYFGNLTYLDLYDNPIRTLPSELTNLTNLKVVDLRGILFNATFQESWKTNLPNAFWHFDLPCECME